jgi:hypothetical protein
MMIYNIGFMDVGAYNLMALLISGLFPKAPRISFSGTDLSPTNCNILSAKRLTRDSCDVLFPAFFRPFDTFATTSSPVDSLPKEKKEEVGSNVPCSGSLLTPAGSTLKGVKSFTNGFM